MQIKILDLMLSVQRGLWGNASLNLRAVCADCDNKKIYVDFFYDGEISEEDHELYESVLDDIYSDYSIETEFYMPSIRLDYPQKIPLRGRWVYYRYEDILKIPVERNSDLFKSHIAHLSDKESELTRMSVLKLSVGDALLGHVTPNLRGVCVNVDENKMYVNFYFDGEISKLDQELFDLSVSRFMEEFKATKVEFDIQMIRLDFPLKPPWIGGWVYKRSEDTSQYPLEN